MSYVVAGSRLTWSGDFDTFAFITQTSGDGVQLVGSALSNKYNLLIERATNVGFFTDTGAKTITLDLRSDMDRNSDDDIRGNVADEWAAIGCACTASRIISITPPGGQSQKTGAPTAPPGGGKDPTAPPPPPGQGKPCSGFWDCITSGEISSGFSQLSNQLEAGTIGLVVGGLAVVGLVIFLALREPV
jgi:hypothetical protein